VLWSVGALVLLSGYFVVRTVFGPDVVGTETPAKGPD